MRNLKNKRAMETEEIMYWFLALLLLGITISVIVMTKNIGHESVKIFPQSNASKDFLFTAENVNLADGSTCTKISDKEYNCKAHNDIYFETTIRNDGSMMRRFYGGIAVCGVTCNTKGTSCTPIDKTCTDNIINGAELCSVKIGESTKCDAGYYNFDSGTTSTYYVYPVATCYLDDTYGCSTSNGKGGATQIITEAQKDYNGVNYIKINVN